MLLVNVVVDNIVVLWMEVIQEQSLQLKAILGADRDMAVFQGCLVSQ